MGILSEGTKVLKAINNIIRSDATEKKKTEQKTANLQNKTQNMYGKTTDTNKPTAKVTPRILPDEPIITSNMNKMRKFIESSKKRNSILENAQKYQGTPYVWGGDSMAEGGMDCSGFIYNVLKDSGYNVNRLVADDYRKYGTPVAKKEMKPGDLIFYGERSASPSGYATHIGVYAGNGQVIHSAGGRKNTRSNPGVGVIVSPVDHRDDFLQAVRY